jgi:hypothetical protein
MCRSRASPSISPTSSTRATTPAAAGTAVPSVTPAPASASVPVSTSAPTSSPASALHVMPAPLGAWATPITITPATASTATSNRPARPSIRYIAIMPACIRNIQ